MGRFHEFEMASLEGEQVPFSTFADGAWQFPLHLQGPRETVFFDV